MFNGIINCIEDFHLILGHTSSGGTRRRPTDSNNLVENIVAVLGNLSPARPGLDMTTCRANVSKHTWRTCVGAVLEMAWCGAAAASSAHQWESLIEGTTGA